MNKAIAVVRLAHGEVAFYDPYTSIHLTLASPESTVFSGQNLSMVKRSVKSGRLILVSGTLNPILEKEIEKTTEDTKSVPTVGIKDTVQEEIKPELIDIKVVLPTKEDSCDGLLQKEEATKEEIVNEVKESVEETIEEETPKKRGRKKKTEEVAE